ncbi:MAG: hypothetical protein IT452_02170 [Planctomycetia bacterium]|nr:hypothetical protein [Planctomycetia bacterium]
MTTAISAAGLESDATPACGPTCTLHDTLCGILREMDLEAGRHWGLEDYGWFARPELLKPMTEWEWLKALEEGLRKRGFVARRRVRYAGGAGGKCDLVVTAPDGARTWLEVRGSWPAYWEAKGNPAKYRWELGAMADDVASLSAIPSGTGDRRALLLIGFGPTGDEFTRDVEDWSGRVVPGWRACHAWWPAENDRIRTVHVWLWTAPA